jgi:hypothetical protein
METLKDYNSTIEKFCKDNVDSTIYLVGEVSHPGISDLDFLIVENKPFISKEVLPYLMGGNILIVPEFVVKDVQMIENFNLKLVNGHGLEFKGKKDYNENEKIIEILEWLPERILKCKSLLETKTDKRSVLLLHKSINRSIEGVANLTGKNYNQISTCEARSSDRYSTSLILKNSINSGMLAWKDFENFLQAGKITGTALGKVNISDHYKFENTFNSLLLYFYRACTIDCQLSLKLSNHLDTNVDLLHIDKDLDTLIVERWKLIDKIYTWFVKKKLKTGMIKYGWLL